MKIKDIPVFNEDGSVEYTQTITENEAQMLLQFALNFLTTTGMMVTQGAKPAMQGKQELND